MSYKRGPYAKKTPNVPLATEGTLQTSNTPMQGQRIAYYRYHMYTIQGNSGTTLDCVDIIKESLFDFLEEIRVRYNFTKVWYVIEKSYHWKKGCHELLCYDNYHAHITVEHEPMQKYKVMETINKVKSKFNFPIIAVCNNPYYGELYIEYVHKDDEITEILINGTKGCQFINLIDSELPDDKQWIEKCANFPDSARKCNDEENPSYEMDKISNKSERMILARKLIINFKNKIGMEYNNYEIYESLKGAQDLQKEVFSVQKELYYLLH